jgi:membrane protein DedA with SNARE-associated domain
MQLTESILLVLSLIFGAFISEDGSVAAAALLILNDQLLPALAVGGALGGIFLSDLTVVAVGRAVSRGHHIRLLRWLEPPPAQVAGARRWLTRHGAWVTILSRFLPGTRVPVCFAAGYLRIPLPRFIAILLTAATIWSLTAIWLITRLGSGIIEHYNSNIWQLIPWVLGVVVTGMLLARLGAMLLEPGGSLLLKARWQRLRRFEFWPIWAAYLPVFLAVPYFALRHGGLWSWRHSNPAIPGGGFRGESKSAILARLATSGAALPRWMPLPPQSPSERAAAIDAFAANRWPVVLKPDVGERGTGVQILYTPPHPHADNMAQQAAILQEFVDGPEFGIHFSRHPAEGTRIHSVHGKQFPAVTGDGHSSLRQLVLAHPRGPLMWRHFHASSGERMDDVPPAGETIPLTDIGNHCKGTVFIDRRDLITPAMVRAVDAILTKAGGFNIGRFDVRAPNEASMADGSFIVIELNGVTGEPGHIYDPQGSILDGWRALLEHWSMAWRIGHAIRRMAPAESMQGRGK